MSTKELLLTQVEAHAVYGVLSAMVLNFAPLHSMSFTVSPKFSLVATEPDISVQVFRSGIVTIQRVAAGCPAHETWANMNTLYAAYKLER